VFSTIAIGLFIVKFGSADFPNVNISDSLFTMSVSNNDQTLS
jgi:hypothetical protein